MPKCFDADYRQELIVEKTYTACAKVKDHEGRKLGDADIMILYRTQKTETAQWDFVPAWHHIQNLKQASGSEFQKLKNGATYHIAVRATSQFKEQKTSVVKVSVDTTAPALWDFRMVCLKRTGAGTTSATGQELCGHKATSRHVLLFSFLPSSFILRSSSFAFLNMC